MVVLDESLLQKYVHLQEIIREAGHVAVAFSGGVDSSLLLKTALDVLGDKVVAFQARSPLQTQDETDKAMDFAGMIGAQLKVFDIDPFSWSKFTANPPDRCYHCKKKIYTLFKAELPEETTQLMDGTNTDDLLDDRPGLKAICELGVKTPLVAANLGKTEIRFLSKHLNLRTWDQPSSSCLATRIPSGRMISRKDLECVAQCERFLHSLNFLGCRVRLEGDSVKIELAQGDTERFTSRPISAKIKLFFDDLGFNDFFLDPSERTGNVI